MSEGLQRTLGATKGRATLLVLFIPSVDRFSVPIDQQHWVEQALATLGTCFGGATAFPRAKGVWRDDDRGGELVFDEPVVVNCYTSEAAIEAHVATLRDFLMKMGTQTNQGAVGLVIDRDYLEIAFPLAGGIDG
ncbi:MAG: hypothetical protein R3C10_17360 [Pirellulales bacterium]